MTPKRKARLFEVLEKKSVKSPSGASKDSWVKQDTPIFVSFYDQSAQNQLTMGASGVRVKQYDYLGLTTNHTLKADDFRLQKGDAIYTIKGVNNEGRLAQLFLEVFKNE